MKGDDAGLGAIVLLGAQGTEPLPWAAAARSCLPLEQGREVDLPTLSSPTYSRPPMVKMLDC